MLRNSTDTALHCQIDAHYARADGSQFAVPLVKRVLLYAGQRTPSLPLAAWLNWDLPGYGTPRFLDAELWCQGWQAPGAFVLRKLLAHDSAFWQIEAPGQPACRPEPGATLKLEIARFVAPGEAFRPAPVASLPGFVLRGSCLSPAGWMSAYRVIVPLPVEAAH